MLLNKQTYTVFVDVGQGQRKWHLSSSTILPKVVCLMTRCTVAYFTQESLPSLEVIDHLPPLSNLQVPHGEYKSARHPKGRPEHIFNPQTRSDVGHPSSQPFPYPPQPHPPHNPNFVLWQSDDSRGISPTTSTDGDANLAPLEYLKTISPMRRHPIDENILLRLRPNLTLPTPRPDPSYAYNNRPPWDRTANDLYPS
jgi:hypothetical protein